MARTNYPALEAQEIAAYAESYLEAGCKTRAEYMAMLANDYCLSISTVRALASLLGPREDFDGLVRACEDTTGDSL